MLVYLEFAIWISVGWSKAFRRNSSRSLLSKVAVSYLLKLNPCSGTKVNYVLSTPSTFFKMGKVENSDPLKVDQEAIKYGIHSNTHVLLSGSYTYIH